MINVSAKLVDTNEITPQSNYVLIYYDGSCLWEPRFDLSVTHCDVNVTWFPFDVQRCEVKFESWFLTSDQLKLNIIDINPLSDYLPSEEWNLTCTYC